jgi:hypothetical protein
MSTPRLRHGVVLVLATAGALSGTAHGQCQHAATLVTQSGAGIDQHFGYPIAIQDEVAVVGAHLDDGAGLNAGAAFVFRRVGQAWVEETPLTPVGAVAGVQFGNAVAMVGHRVMVGAWLDNEAAPQAGAVHVFEEDLEGWSSAQKLQASRAGAGAFFGASLAGAGDVAVVGAPGSDEAGTNAGAAYVFRFLRSSWVEQAVLFAEEPTFNAQFGVSVATDGFVIVVGSSLDDVNGTNSGAAYVFRFDGEAWNHETTIIGSDSGPQDQFGTSVAVDGDTIVVGAPGEDDAGPSSGAAYVFGFDGVTWTELAKSVPIDTQAGDEYGSAVAIDGSRALVGAHQDDDSGPEHGAIYVYDVGGGAPVETCKLIAAEDAPTHGHFGLSASVDGDTVVGGGAGIALVFEIADTVPGDSNGDGMVDVLDLVAVISSWGSCPGCPADLNDDGVVDVLDLVLVISNWG